MTGALRIGVDLGGTKIEAVALNHSGAILARRRLPTPSGDYHGTLRTIVELVTGIEAELGTGGGFGGREFQQSHQPPHPSPATPAGYQNAAHAAPDQVGITLLIGGVMLWLKMLAAIQLNHQPG